MTDPRQHPAEGELHLPAEDVSHAYRAAAREEPPPELDDTIRAAARRGLSARPRPRETREFLRWGIPLAVAATLVVGVSIAFLATDRRDLTMPSPGAPPPAPDATVLQRMAPTTAPPEPLAKALPPAMETQQPSPLPRSHEVRPSRERTTRDEMFRKRESAPTVEPSEVSPTLPGAAADAARGAPMPAPPQEVTPMRSVPPAAQQADQQGEMPSPEVWLQRIRELRTKGNLARADESLRAFRRRYPDYPLPADIPAPADITK